MLVAMHAACITRFGFRSEIRAITEIDGGGEARHASEIDGGGDARQQACLSRRFS